MKRILVMIMMSSLLAACVNRDLEVTSNVEPEARFRNASGPLGVLADEDSWWSSFEDDQLLRLIAQAEENNRMLVASRAQVRAALANADIARAGLLPSLGLQGQLGSEETLINPDGLSQAASFGLGAQWKLDLFGQERNKHAANLALVYSQEEETEGIRMAVVSGTASTYLAWVNACERERVLRESIEIARRSIDVAEAFFQEGVVTDFEVQSARSQLEETKAMLPELLAAKEKLRNALAVLMGVQSSELVLEERDWSHVHVPEIPAVAPSTVLLNRPDVRAARRKVQAQMYALGAAKAAFYPSFNLNMLGQYQYLHFSVPQMPNLEGPVSAFALDATLPIFAAGKIRAAVRGEEARLDAVAAVFENTLLTAIADAETAYASFAQNRERAELLKNSAESAVKAEERFGGLYEAGSVNLLDWLKVQGDRQKRMAVALEAELDYLLSAVDLHEAIGGFSED